MRIALIDGSPRGRKSTSDFLLNKVGNRLGETTVTDFHLTAHVQDEVLERILEHDVLVFAFPNYYGSIPSHLMEALERMEQLSTGKNMSEIIVYTIVNCGFYYSEENKIALEIMHNWCDKMNLTWGQGVSLGAGGSFQVMYKIVGVNLMLIPVTRALNRLAKLVLQKEKRKDSFVKIYMPCKMYIFIAERIWYGKAAKNGLRGKNALETLPF